MNPVRGIILDVDGTLVDSNDAHAHSWVEALAEQDVHVPFEKVRKLIGAGSDKLLPRAAGIELDTPQGQKISKRREEIFKERYLPSLKPTPGASELLQHIHARGLPMVVGSSAKKTELSALLRICKADKLIEGQTSSDDAEQSKPDPDIVHVALANLKQPASAAIMLGDTPYDVEAARRAGVATIAFRCGGWADADLKGALAVYDHPADLLAHYDDSPLGKASKGGGG